MTNLAENVMLYISIAIGYMYYGHYNATLKDEKLSSSKSVNSLNHKMGGMQDPTYNTEGIEVLQLNNGHNHHDEVTFFPIVYRHYKPRVPSVPYQRSSLLTFPQRDVKRKQEHFMMIDSSLY